jgi:hypothetical protein
MEAAMSRRMPMGSLHGLTFSSVDRERAGREAAAARFMAAILAAEII